MRLISAAIAALALGVTAASAAEPVVPRPAAAPAVVIAKPLWNGLYLGINGGFAQGTGRFLQSANNTPALAGPSSEIDVNGALFGATAGWNMQRPGSPFVLGFEADVDWSNASGAAPCAGDLFTCNMKNDFLATFRARVGVSANILLLYATGGIAVGEVHPFTTGTTNFGSPVNGVPPVDGFAFGAGAEALIHPRLSVKLEWLRLDLGRGTCGAPVTPTTPSSCAPGPGPANFEFKTDVFRGGLNVHF